MTAAEAMHLALISLTDRGLRPPCGNPSTRDRWTSDNHEDREAAALACAPCPLTELCREFAVDVKASHGVWAGVDLTRTTRATKPAPLPDREGIAS